MTNKLPVVGKRYKTNANFNLVYCYGSNATCVMTLNNSKCEFLIPTDLVMALFEELPEEKAETKPETQSHISELNPEVKEAMEELRKNIKQIVDNITGTFIPLAHINFNENKKLMYETLYQTQSLLNALDKQFNVTEFGYIKIQAEEFADNKIEPDENGSFKHLDNAEKMSQDIMKEESIWKPMRELDKSENNDLFLRTKDKRILLGECLVGVLYKHEEYDFITLTDFINDYEKLKERDRSKEAKLRELEEKIKNLEKIIYPS